MGYHPGQVKQAIIELDPRTETLLPATLQRVAPALGDVDVLTAEPARWGRFLRYDYAVFDFTAVQERGMYRVRYGEQVTPPFAIARDVYRHDVWQPTLETYFPVQMREKCDVVVIGGGPGGVCAAVGAAQQGAEVLLVERYGFLGGMATAGLGNPFVPYRLKGQRMTSGVFNELLERLEAHGALAKDGMVFDDEAMKLVLERMMQEHGVNLLFHAFFFDVVMDGRRIERALDGQVRRDRRERRGLHYTIF